MILYIACFMARLNRMSSDLVLKAQTKAATVLRSNGIAVLDPKYGESFNSVIDGLVEGEDLEC